MPPQKPATAPDDDADEARDDHAPEADREGDARSMDGHREHVATVAVGAEDVLRARWIASDPGGTGELHRLEGDDEGPDDRDRAPSRRG